MTMDYDLINITIRTIQYDFSLRRTIIIRTQYCIVRPDVKR